MVPKILKLLEDALTEARVEQMSAGRSPRGRDWSLCVTHLEDAWIRAKVALGNPELTPPGRT